MPRGLVCSRLLTPLLRLASFEKPPQLFLKVEATPHLLRAGCLGLGT
jgi:hypothetical protein